MRALGWVSGAQNQNRADVKTLDERQEEGIHGFINSSGVECRRHLAFFPEMLFKNLSSNPRVWAYNRC